MGAVAWIDLSGGDPAFYAGLFGWELGAGGVFTLGGRPVAGHGGPVPADNPPAWTPYVDVDDPALAAARVAAGGGRIELSPRDTPRGPVAIVADPTGARFALRAPTARPEPATGPGTLSWTEVCTADLAVARAFYVDQFGWDAVDITMSLPSGEVPYTVFCRAGAEVAGLMPLGDPFPPGPPRWLAHIEVADCAATAARAAALGGTVPVPPLDIPRIGRVALLAAPTTETLAVIQLPPAGR